MSGPNTVCDPAWQGRTRPSRTDFAEIGCGRRFDGSTVMPQRASDFVHQDVYAWSTRSGQLGLDHAEEEVTMLKRPDHITIGVTDLFAAKSFFELLGFEVTIEAVIRGDTMEEYMSVPDIEADHVTMVLPGAEAHFEIQLLHFRWPEVRPDPDSGISPGLGSTNCALRLTISKGWSRGWRRAA